MLLQLGAGRTLDQPLPQPVDQPLRAGQLLRPLVLPQQPIDQLVRDLSVAHQGPPSGPPDPIASAHGYAASLTTGPDRPVGYTEIRALPISAGKLLACDPARFKSEAAFARCNGTAPQPASSGKTIRHRLSRGGDRQVNNAIHTIALSRSIHHAETRAYLERRISEGNTRREAMRSLKRHLSRRLYKRLIELPLTS
jgi:hypothetical protein